MKMDNLLKWLGAEVVDYPVKAHCCGGHMTQISEPQAFELSAGCCSAPRIIMQT